MKRFVYDIAKFFLPLVALAVIMELSIRNIPNDYSYKNQYLTNHSDKIEVLFLGNSHAFYGINPKYIKGESFNAAYVSQTLDYDFKILKKYTWGKLKCVVIPVDYFSLYMKLEQTTERWRVQDYEMYYGISSPKVSTELFTHKLHSNLERVFSYYFRGKDGVTCSGKGWGTRYHSSESLDLVKTGIESAKRHTTDDDNNFNTNLSTLGLIIEWARMRNVKIVLYTSPAYKTYVANLDKVRMERTIRAVESLGVEYHNLLNTDLKADDFYDADHLNEIGAEKFSKKLNEFFCGV